MGDMHTHKPHAYVLENYYYSSVYLQHYTNSMQKNIQKLTTMD